MLSCETVVSKHNKRNRPSYLLTSGVAFWPMFSCSTQSYFSLGQLKSVMFYNTFREPHL